MKDRIAEAFGGGNQTLETITRQNLAMFERAMKMFTPFGMAPGAQKGEEPIRTSGPTQDAKAKPSEDITELKNEMEAMRRQLAELARERK
jgi:polyhydroxyalkanoate synthesis regulator protein